MSPYLPSGAPPEYMIYKINIMKKSLFLVLAGSFASLFFSRQFSLGFFVGGAVSVANFSLLAGYILRMRGLSSRKARGFIVSRFLVMYLIMAVTLFIGITKGLVVFTAAALGLLAVKFAIFLNGIPKRYVESI